MNSYYAAWRAECCKADIEMGLDDGPQEREDERRKASHREYARKWRAAHKRDVSLST